MGREAPLARGIRKINLRHALKVRFIPAGAGNTCFLSLSAPWPPVYPRWRGEHGKQFCDWANFPGLSPLARGTLLHSLRSCFKFRFIPAGAGNTTGGRAQFRRTTVYPRWRGEHYNGMNPVFWFSGLSPLARGTPAQPLACLATGRFIPAGAGNTTVEFFTSKGITVYPRWRGEHYLDSATNVYSAGLSPLARGTLTYD